MRIQSSWIKQVLGVTGLAIIILLLSKLVVIFLIKSTNDQRSFLIGAEFILVFTPCIFVLCVSLIISLWHGADLGASAHDAAMAITALALAISVENQTFFTLRDYPGVVVGMALVVAYTVAFIQYARRSDEDQAELVAISFVQGAILFVFNRYWYLS